MRKVTLIVLSVVVCLLLPVMNVAQTTGSSICYLAYRESTDLWSPIAGFVRGSLLDTYADDGVVETISEKRYSGKPAYDALEHWWWFAANGDGLQVCANAWALDAGDPDEIVFEYQAGVDPWEPMFTIGSSPEDTYCSRPLYVPPTHLLKVRVVDTYRDSVYKRALDVVYVDHLYIKCEEMPE